MKVVIRVWYGWLFLVVPTLSFDQEVTNVPRISTPVIDANLLALESMETGRTNSMEAPRFAVPFDSIDYTPDIDGAWEATADGWNVWRLVIECPGAVHVNLGFSSYHMPEGGSMVISNTGNATQPAMSTSFTSSNNADHGELWTPIYLGDTVELEVALPPNVPRTDLLLTLSSINAGFRGFGGDAAPSGKSGSCNVDVVCEEGDDWRDEISSVAVYSQGGSRFCTGTLINTAVGDGTPYFLTAYHCGVNDDREARSLVVYWNFETSSCRRPQPNGRLSQFQQGATFAAGWDQTDFTLLLLDGKPDEAWNIHYAGFDRSGTATSKAITIHHPQGDEKRISFENDPTTTTSHESNTVSPTGTHIRVADWDLGTTEAGSSGAPLFNANHRIVGQLHGGWAACNNDEPDWFGRLHRSWEGAGSKPRRLKDWLDPNNTGVMTVNTASIRENNGPSQPTAPAPTAPAPSPPACFSGLTTVTVRGIGLVPIQNVKIGDLVLVGGHNYEPVYSFCKRAPKAIAEFIQVSLATSQATEPLELTANHLLFVVKNGHLVSVSASKLQVGDLILYENGEYVAIAKLQSVVRHGAYAPYTASGTIVVNGILASTYATMNDEGILSQDYHSLFHFAQTPHRVFCRYFSEWCRRETYSGENGLSPIAELSLYIYEFVSTETLAVARWGYMTFILIGLLLVRAVELINTMFVVLLVSIYWRVKYLQRRHK